MTTSGYTYYVAISGTKFPHGTLYRAHNNNLIQFWNCTSGWRLSLVYDLESLLLALQQHKLFKLRTTNENEAKHLFSKITN